MGLLYQCEICNRTIVPHYVEYDWDYNVNDDGEMDGKTEWFICPHCGACDENTNVTYSD